MYKYTIDFSKIDSSKYYFDKEDANKAVLFIETFIQHVKGKLAGKPYILQNWEKEYITNLFGWKNIETGLRKYRESFLFLPRKNSKTTLSSAIMLYLLIVQSKNDRGGEFYIGASSREQARIAFTIMKSMVLENKQLAQYIKVFKNSLEFDKTNSFLKVVSSESGNLHGASLSGCLIDEFHAHKDRDLYDVFKTSMGAREQPLLITITTAGSDRNSACYELYDYAKKIIDGVIEDDNFLPFVFEGEDFDDLKKLFHIDNIKRANPGFGVSIREDAILEEITKARSMPTFLNSFKQLHLNIWVDSTMAWITNSDWMLNKSDYSEDDLLGQECWAGLDLANNRDLNALVLVFPQPDKTFKVLTYSFLPMEAAERKDNISAGRAFLGWALNTNNHLYLTANRSRDDDFLFEKIKELSEKFIIKNIGYDRWGADQLVARVQNELGLKFTGFGQGYKSMSPAIKKVESLIVEKKLIHNNNPVLKWCLSNVRLTKDPAGNIKVDKEKAKDKIDAIVAMIIALGQYFIDEVEELENQSNSKSVYEDRGFFFV
ncbi:phage terminase large subunit-like protein [Algoriphagus sp. 4150]|uniref:terminase large subunit n=1 Tax=Algoriphagus sp. 4150 TaxID=2817756 RepID=UPI002865E4CC|nr:terminase TerL endonuclease subunit [Algoriphagus sp. 4150]MDR7130699.1 phage terminase large subunit-like protein [Algoriphagus sp. 4150]